VPAPRPLLFAEDASVIGAEFYVMEKVDGGILARELPSGWLDRTADRARLCERFVDGLVAIHAVDCRAAGLADLGRPGGYVERQIRGWNRRYVDALTPDVPDCAGIRAWLEARMPTEAGATLVHGDYRLDNIVLEAERGASPRIAAVLDWEMATIGDPLMDLGNALAYWVEARDPEELHALRMQPSHAEGMWTRAQILEHYSRRTGLSTARFDFYRVYGLFRLAVIVQQIYYRWFHKQTANPRFATFGRWVEVLARRCREAIDRAA
jgi:aminoglycoside phosphotransferase (APT) family kinase protein